MQCFTLLAPPFWPDGTTPLSTYFYITRTFLHWHILSLVWLDLPPFELVHLAITSSLRCQVICWESPAAVPFPFVAWCDAWWYNEKNNPLFPDSKRACQVANSRQKNGVCCLCGDTYMTSAVGWSYPKSRRSKWGYDTAKCRQGAKGPWMSYKYRPSRTRTQTQVLLI